MRSKRILHLASFSGNYGDIVNHNGFYNNFARLFDGKLQIAQEEIRDYYTIRRNKSFDSSFVEYVNKFDLLVIGGGNFLSPFVEESATGTTIDISKEHLRNISVPMFFNAVGCEGSLSYTEKSLEKLGSFLHLLLFDYRSRALLSVRNDGSYDFIKEHFGESYASKIHLVPDNAFFQTPAALEFSSSEEKFIGFVLSGDRVKSRLETKYYLRFISDIKSVLDAVASRDYKVVLIPHTYYDLDLYNDLLKALSDKQRRETIVISPLFPSFEGQRVYDHFYSMCSRFVCMRFHGCVNAFVFRKPFTAVFADKRVKNLLDDLGVREYSCITDPQLTQNILNGLEFADKERDRILNEFDEKHETLESETHNFYRKLEAWLVKTE